MITNYLLHPAPKMKPLILVTLILMPLVITAEESVYTVTAQGRLISDSTYDITVALVNGTESLRFVAALNPSSGLPSDGGTLALGSLELQPGNTTTLTLRVPPLINSAFYYMHLDGSGAANFSHALKLLASPRAVLLHVFTDKDKFNPGETVHFNVIAMADEVRARDVTGMNITITDPRGKVAASWNNVATTLGAFSGQYEISERSHVFGSYKLTAEIQDHKMVKTLTVTDHEFPLFHVRLETPDFVDVDVEKSINITVNACYLSGLPVTGNLSVSAEQSLACIFDPEKEGCGLIFQNNSLKIVDGEATIEVQLKSLKPSRSLHIHAVVNDSLAGRSHEAYEHIILTHNPLRVVITQTRDRFKPGIPFELQVTVGYLDGTKPAKNASEELVITGTFALPSSAVLTSKQTIPIPDDGHVAITLIPPAGAVALRFNATYAGITTNKVFVADSTAGGNYISVQQSSHFPKVGEILSVPALATSEIGLLFYQVVSGSNGSILASGSTHGNGTNAIVHIEITDGMVPLFEILVFYVTPKGEVVCDSESFATESFSENLQVGVQPDIVQPGGLVNVKIRSSSPNTLVFLSGIDHGARFLRPTSHTGYRLDRSEKTFKGGKGKGSKEEVPKKPTKGPETGRSFGNSGQPDENEQLFVPHHFKVPLKVQIGSQSTSSATQNNFNTTLQQAGVFFFTNGDVSSRFLNEKPTANEEESLIGRQESPQISEGILEEEVSLKDRDFFPITWFWTNITTSEDSSTNFIVKVPDSITTWDISALGVSPSYALGLPSAYPQVEVYKDFFVQLLVPFSIQRGEAADIQVLVFNPTNGTIRANVTILNSAARFQLLSDTTNAPLAEQSNATKTVEIGPNSGASTCFLISPLYLGHVDVKVTADDGQFTDTVIEKILVQSPQPGPLFQGEDGVVTTAEDIEGRNDALANSTKLFNVTAQVHILGSGSAFRLDLCIETLKDGVQGVLVEVALPSGYKVRPERLTTKPIEEDEPRKDTKRKRTVAILYFRKMPKSVCVAIRAVRWQKVINLKPALVRVFDAEASKPDDILAKLMYTVQAYERKK